MARGTAQARLDKLVAVGIITDWGPNLSAEALGFPVTAFLTLEIRQGAGHDTVAAHLAAIPEVLEAFTITGAGDMWARVVARLLAPGGRFYLSGMSSQARGLTAADLAGKPAEFAQPTVLVKLSLEHDRTFTY